MFWESVPQVHKYGPEKYVQRVARDSATDYSYYIQSQCNKETEDQFTDELQILSRKLLGIYSEWKAEVSEALKT